MTDFFPKNDLERRLLAAQNGDIPAEAFLETLLNAEVFMPIHERHRIGGLQTSLRLEPLKLQADGEPVLVLFTSPERARTFVQDFPGYEGGLVVEFRWILETLGIGFGISLNPDGDLGIDLRAQDLAQLAAREETH